MKLSGTLITIAVIILIPILFLGFAIVYYYSHQTIKMDKHSKKENISGHANAESDEYISIFDEEEHIDE